MACDVMRVRLHLRQIRVLAVASDTPSELVVEVESTVTRPRCPARGFGCGRVLRNVTVSMAAKSQATAAWDRRNCDQVTLEGVGAGSIPALLRICQTVEAARWWPSPASSPWTRR